MKDAGIRLKFPVDLQQSLADQTIERCFRKIY